MLKGDFMVKDGDVVLIDYTAKVDGNVFDTTNLEEAKKANIFRKEAKYEPMLAIIGKNMLIKGLEEAVVSMKEGEEKEFTVPPEKAFGNRDPSLVKLVSLSQFRKQDINPVPGAVVEIDGKPARIQTVNGGRVRVDFNSLLAGKDILYKTKLVKIITEPEEKIKKLAEYSLGVKDVKYEKDKKEAVVSVPSTTPKNAQYFISKTQFVSRALSSTDIQKLIIKEEYTKNGKKSEKEEQSTEVESGKEKSTGDEEGKAQEGK